MGTAPSKTLRPGFSRAAALAALVTAACAGAPPGREAAGTVDAGRVDAALGNNVIEVQPLVEPGVAALLSRARRETDEGRLRAARRTLGEARALAPRDPAVWQELAELSLERGAWRDALVEARTSYELGPRVGRLCARNWLTMAQAHAALGASDDAGAAEREARGCSIRLPERL